MDSYSLSSQETLTNDDDYCQDEVDFVRTAAAATATTNPTQRTNNNNLFKMPAEEPKNKKQQQQQQQEPLAIIPPELYRKTTATTTTPPKERYSIFSWSSKSKAKSAEEKQQQKDKKSKEQQKKQNVEETENNLLNDKGFPCEPQTIVPNGSPPRHNKFTKSSSIARLLSGGGGGSSTYTSKKDDSIQQQDKHKLSLTKFNTYGGRRKGGKGPYLERFKRYAKEEGDKSTNNVIPINATAEAAAKETNGGSTAELYDSANLLALEHFHEPKTDDLGSKAMRTLTRGLGKLWWRRTHSVDISTPDPEFKVSYLGNVLTGWAKGEGCVEKQLNTLWRNYNQNTKPDVIMRLKVCASGLKATTRQHGLTEYWANRITHCCAPKNYPRVFCWIYRHEGRKLKHELRCHAVLCSKEKQVQEICDTLKANLECALREFKREKILKQNARLSLANAVYDNPSLPRRKILLSVGGNNYRPPLERSKSAPKLMAIEEAIGEEGEEAEETNEPEMKPCCQKDSLYPAMTLGRRRCRRGHSIRRTGKTRPLSYALDDSSMTTTQDGCCSGNHHHHHHYNNHHYLSNTIHETKELILNSKNNSQTAENNSSGLVAEEAHIIYGSDDSDDFEKILKHNNYDRSTSLTNELLPYFESQLHKNILMSSSCGSLSDLKDHETLAQQTDEETAGEPLSLLATLNHDPNADPINDFKLNQEQPETAELSSKTSSLVIRRSGVCSDGEEDFLGEEEDDMYFRQHAILNMLHRHSMRKMANLSMSSDEGSSSLETNCSSGYHQAGKHFKQSSISSCEDTNSSVSSASASANGMPIAAPRKQHHHHHRHQHSQLSQSTSNDSADEGSISSGCETASTVTNNAADELTFKYNGQGQQSLQFPNSINTLTALVDDINSDDLDETSLEAPVSAEEIYFRLQQKRNNSSDAATTFSSSSSITLKMGNSPSNLSLNELTTLQQQQQQQQQQSQFAQQQQQDEMKFGNIAKCRRLRKSRSDLMQNNNNNSRDSDTDSECSDESGYVEYQEQHQHKKTINATATATTTLESSAKIELKTKPQLAAKPQVPPKPMPRRFLATSTSQQQQQLLSTVATTTSV